MACAISCIRSRWSNIRTALWVATYHGWKLSFNLAIGSHDTFYLFIYFGTIEELLAIWEVGALFMLCYILLLVQNQPWCSQTCKGLDVDLNF